jgi:hypothetical protein
VLGGEVAKDWRAQQSLQARFGALLNPAHDPWPLPRTHVHKTHLVPRAQGVFWAGAALLAVPVAFHTRMADHAHAADALQGDALDQPSAAAAAAAAGLPTPAAQLDFGGRVQLLAFCGFEVGIGGGGAQSGAPRRMRQTTPPGPAEPRSIPSSCATGPGRPARVEVLPTTPAEHPAHLSCANTAAPRLPPSNPPPPRS